MARATRKKPPKARSNRYRSARERRGAKRESLGDLFRHARHEAERKSNMRRGRRSSMMARAAIAETAPSYDLGFAELNWTQRCTTWAKALMLLPFIFITVKTLMQPTNDADFMHHFWRSKELLFFGIGVVLMLGWFWSRLFSQHFLYFYVLGHELTHALFVYLSLGRVSDLRVSTEGGYILTNKSNLLIALSPYFIPFWSLVILSLSGFAIFFFGPLPHGDDVLLLLLGGTWCFHLVWTLWMIPRDQPDLQEHGTLFSLMIILLANLIVLTGMACITSPALEFSQFGYRWWNNAEDILRAGYRTLFHFSV